MKISHRNVGEFVDSNIEDRRPVTFPRIKVMDKNGLPKTYENPQLVFFQKFQKPGALTTAVLTKILVEGEGHFYLLWANPKNQETELRFKKWLKELGSPPEDQVLELKKLWVRYGNPESRRHPKKK